MQTYALQETLPPLPLPPLTETMERLVRWTRPLVDEATHQQTRKNVAAFLKNEGPRLQEKLAAFKNETNGNWMSPFAEARRTEYRNPIPLVLSYAFQIREDALAGLDRFQKLAHISLGLASFYLTLEEEKIEPEQIGDTPLCMSTYNYLFYTRIAGHRRDTVHLPPAGGTKHIAVLANNRFFTLPLIKNRKIYPGWHALSAAFETLSTKAESPEVNYGAISFANRTAAARLRDVLQGNPISRQNMAALENALFVVNLDRGYAGQQAFWENLLGGSENRFYDKSLQVVSSEDGKIGFCLEHMGSDATAWLNVLDHIVSFTPEDTGTADRLATRALAFELSAAESRKLKKMGDDFRTKEADVILKRYELEAFSRPALKSLGVSPDAFCQVAFNTAQYLTLKKMGSTYESVAVRQFVEGRTEAGRPATQEVLEYAQALEAGESKLRLKAKFLQAAKAHLEMVRLCKEGRGVQRHMTGLLNMYQIYGKELSMDEKPALFDDPGYQELITDSISSSSIMHPALRHFGFGMQTDHGLGIGLGYVVRPDALAIIIMARRRNRGRFEKFCRHLENVLTWDAEIAAPPKQPKTKRGTRAEN